MKIYDTYKEQTDAVVTHLTEHGYDVVAVGLRGSRHFGLAEQDSDYDFEAFVLPKLHDLFFSEKIYKSAEYEISDLISVHVHTIQAMPKMFDKVSFTFVEFLTKLTYVSESFLPTLTELVETFESALTKQFDVSVYFSVGGQQAKRLMSETEPKRIAKIHAKLYLYKELLELGAYKTYKADELPKHVEKEYHAYKQQEKVMTSELLISLCDYFTSKEVMSMMSKESKLTGKFEEYQSIIEKYLVEMIKEKY